MLDLSNNNSKGHNFKTAYKSGQRRLYLKATEGVSFEDPTFDQLRVRAQRAGFKVGGYNFLRPFDATPREVVDFFEKNLRGSLRPGDGLRPCLDVEDPKQRPTARMGQWVGQVATLLRRDFGFQPVIYGSGPYLEACKFTKIFGALWLASYGSNDGKEHPVHHVPAPWKTVTALQFTSNATVPGIQGRCDLSHVFVGKNLDIPTGV